MTFAEAAAQSTFDVTSTMPSAYPSCASSASITVTWSHLNTRGDHGKVLIYMSITEIPDGGLVTFDERTGNAARGTRRLTAPTHPASDSTYRPNWSGNILIFPGSDTSQPYIRIAQFSLGNVTGCTGLT